MSKTVAVRPDAESRGTSPRRLPVVDQAIKRYESERDGCKKAQTDAAARQAQHEQDRERLIEQRVEGTDVAVALARNAEALQADERTVKDADTLLRVVERKLRELRAEREAAIRAERHAAR